MCLMLRLFRSVVEYPINFCNEVIILQFKGIIVKVITKKLGEKYHKKKGTITVLFCLISLLLKLSRL